MRAIRVRQIPAAHVYVDHLRPVEDDGRVVHLPELDPPRASRGKGAVHPALDPAWIRAHADEQDVVHLHFGTESRSRRHLARWLRAVKESGLPLVHTVHDIEHPYLRDQARHREHLALLVEHSDALLTLTEGAAARIEGTFGRRPQVVPHPHVAPLDVIDDAPRRDPGDSLRIGLHLKNLRANFVPMRVLPTLLEAVDRVRDAGIDARLEIRAHPDVLDPRGPRHDPVLARLLRRLKQRADHADPGVAGGLGAGAGALAAGLGTVDSPVAVVVADHMDDAALWSYLGCLDVSVLPYAWATHSGWLEACRDLGTWVLAPEVGHLAEQGRFLSWGSPDDPPSVDVLTDLLTFAVAHRAPRGNGAERVAQRTWLAARHTQIYQELLGDPPGEPAIAHIPIRSTT